MQKETIGLPEQLLFLFFFFLLTAFFFFLVTRRKKLAGDVGESGGWWERGIKLNKTEKTKWITLRWFQLFGSSYAMKQQYILNLTNDRLYFTGRGNMATAAFFRDLKSLRLKFFKFHPPSSLLILSHPLWTLTSRFRDDVVMFYCEGTAHTSTENKHYSCFLFSIMLHIIVFILECVWCWC